jgi:hypothetical protein
MDGRRDKQTDRQIADFHPVHALKANSFARLATSQSLRDKDQEGSGQD